MQDQVHEREECSKEREERNLSPHLKRSRHIRRVHKKSRLGCSDCKRRRVKCGEEKPGCQNCTRFGTKCSFLSTTPIIIADHRFRIKTVKIPKSTQDIDRNRPSLDAGLQPATLDLKSLELFYHYISEACFTLATPKAIFIWQVAIPQMAFSHAFLMHGLLAISALHLASLQPQRALELQKSAFISKQAALSLFRRVAAEIGSDDTHAVFAFSWFVVPYVLSLSGGSQSSKIPNFDGESPHWFLVIRGLIALLWKNWMDLVNGPFSPLLAQTSGEFSKSSNPDDGELAKLHQILAPKDDVFAEEETELAACRVALEELRRVSALPYAPCNTLPSTSSVFLWTGTVTDEFLQLLYKRKPEALVVLAYYCVLLKRVNSIWYFKGVGETLLDAINNKLDKKWKPWIAWAVQQPSE